MKPFKSVFVEGLGIRNEDWGINVGDIVSYWKYSNGGDVLTYDRVDWLWSPSREDLRTQLYNFDLYFYLDHESDPLNPTRIKLFLKGPFTKEEAKNLIATLNI